MFGNNCCWIIILILLFTCGGCGGCGSTFANNGCGCGNTNRGCGGTTGCGCGKTDCGGGCYSLLEKTAGFPAVFIYMRRTGRIIRLLCNFSNYLSKGKNKIIEKVSI